MVQHNQENQGSALASLHSQLIIQQCTISVLSLHSQLIIQQVYYQCTITALSADNTAVHYQCTITAHHTTAMIQNCVLHLVTLLPGVCHGDDMAYTIDCTKADHVESQEDKKMSQLLLDIWTSYAHNG
jgi:hypothetical protein